MNDLFDVIERKPAAPVKPAAVAVPSPVQLPAAFMVNTGTAKVGAEVTYRCINGNYWRAKVLAVRLKGGIDIEVFSPGGLRLLHLTRIAVAPNRAACAPGQAYVGDGASKGV
jgi:hypothetical protein